jgi:hypothetical protein
VRIPVLLKLKEENLCARCPGKGHASSACPVPKSVFDPAKFEQVQQKIKQIFAGSEETKHIVLSLLDDNQAETDSEDEDDRHDYDHDYELLPESKNG